MGNKLKIKTETKFYYNFKLLADNFYEDGLYVAGVLRSCACLSSLHLTRLPLKSILVPSAIVLLYNMVLTTTSKPTFLP